MTFYQPKGGMCMACAHKRKDCSSLPFHSMPIIKRDKQVAIVACTEYARTRTYKVDPGAPPPKELSSEGCMTKLRIRYTTYVRQERFDVDGEGNPVKRKIEAVDVALDDLVFHAVPCKRDGAGFIYEIDLPMEF